MAAIAVFLAFAAALSPAQVDSAESPAIEMRQVEIGYGGTYKSGFWAPIWLTLRSPQTITGRVEVLAPDGDGVPVAYAAAPGGSESSTELKANEDVTVCIFVKIGPERSSLSIHLRDVETGKVLWQARLPGSTPKPLSSTLELVVSLGESTATAEATRLVRRSEERRVVAATIADAARVPEFWWGWEGVETIVLSTSAGNLSERLSPSQWRALRQWVELGGGRLVICIGERGREVLAAGAPLEELAPGKLVEVSPLRDLRKLEELTGQPLAVTGDASRPQVAHLADVRGRVEATVTGLSGEVPLMVRTSYGFGEVVFLGVDPEGPALAGWSGCGRLLLPAITAGGRTALADETPRRTLSRLGYDDLSGQLRASLEYFQQVRAINVTTVAILTLAYVALIGPIDFFLVRRLKWPVLTWFSFSLSIAVFCIVGWYAARAAHGTAVKANRCEIIDIDLDRRLARGTTWVHLYNPGTSSHNVSLHVDPLRIGLASPVEGWLTWQGLPGNGLGGLAANQLAVPTLVPYQTSFPGPKLALSDVPIQMAGSKAMSARWWGKMSMSESSALSINPHDMLAGEVVNPVPIELHDSLLIFDEWMYRLKTLSPGQRVRLADFDPLNLEARLQQRTIANAKDVMSPWERDSTEVPRIVQMLMFHESARGTTYTNLTHRYQGYLDLTPRARNGRAILVGRVARLVTQLRLDGEPFAAGSQSESWTWVRVVLPVSPRGNP